MMSRLERKGIYRLAVILLLLPAVLCSCRSVPPDIYTPWQNGEITVMEVSREGELLFYEESRIDMEGSLLLFTVEYQFAAEPLVRRIYMDQETLLPGRNETIFSTAAGEKSKLEVLYGEKEITVEKSIGQGGGDAIVKAPLPASPFFDNDQFPLLVRALPLEAGWKGKLRLFVPATARTATVNLEVVRREEVTVPAGTFTCHVVELADLAQWAWVGVDSPHYLVRYVNEGAGTLSELAEYFPGGSEEDPGD